MVVKLVTRPAMLTNQSCNAGLNKQCYKKKKRIYLETSADFTSFTKKKKRRNIDDKYLITTTSYKSLTVMISQYIYTEEVYLLRETGC